MSRFPKPWKVVDRTNAALPNIALVAADDETILAENFSWQPANRYIKVTSDHEKRAFLLELFGRIAETENNKLNQKEP